MRSAALSRALHFDPMTIIVTKFGTILTSRQAGKEAYAAFLPLLMNVDAQEQVLVDFDGVNAFSPSWGDEFLTPLQKMFGDRLTLKNISNPSVALTIKMLQKINNAPFKTL